MIRFFREGRGGIAVVLSVMLALSGPGLAHEGHDHGDAPPPPASAAPRAEARSDLFEIVAVLGPDGRLWLYLDRYATAMPIENATIQINVDGREVNVARADNAVFVATDPAFTQAGSRNMSLIVTAGDDVDLLPLSFDVPPVAAVASSAPAIRERLLAAAGEPLLWVIAAVLLLLGFGAGRAAAPRALPARAEEDPFAASPTPAVAVAAVAAKANSAAPTRVRTAALGFALMLALPSVGVAQPMDQPRRQPDGSVFIPKPTQRLLGVRTVVVDRAEAPISVQVVGQVIADPNASGRVQAPQAGRIEAPEVGFPALGSQVRRGQVLAFVVPVLAAQERGSAQANLAELEAQIGIAQQRVQRLSGLAGSVSAREIGEARAELDGLRARRAALADGLNGREPVRAPVTGVLSVVGAVNGQIVDAREVLFEVVDPDRLWVEAVAFDAAAVAEISGADAITAAGQNLPLVFVGRGLSLRQQAVPLQFRITAPPPGLSVGTPVTVTVQTPRRADGIVLPAEAIVRSADGPQVVFEMPGAERFVPRSVRVQPLDGRHVLVTAGLDRGARVVTEAASLIAQVR